MIDMLEYFAAGSPERRSNKARNAAHAREREHHARHAHGSWRPASPRETLACARRRSTPPQDPRRRPRARRASALRRPRRPAPKCPPARTQADGTYAPKRRRLRARPLEARALGAVSRGAAPLARAQRVRPARTTRSRGARARVPAFDARARLARRKLCLARRRGWSARARAQQAPVSPPSERPPRGASSPPPPPPNRARSSVGELCASPVPGRRAPRARGLKDRAPRRVHVAKR